MCSPRSHDQSQETSDKKTRCINGTRNFFSEFLMKIRSKEYIEKLHYREVRNRRRSNSTVNQQKSNKSPNKWKMWNNKTILVNFK